VEVRELAVWCNNLSEATRKVDYKKSRDEHDPILIDRAVLEQGCIESFKFLGVHITNKLS
jgi:hypothetical protein